MILIGACDDADSPVPIGSNGVDTNEVAQQLAVTGVDAAVEQAAAVTPSSGTPRRPDRGLTTASGTRANYTNNGGGDVVDWEAGAPTNQPVRLGLFNVGKPTTYFVQGDIRRFEHRLSVADGLLWRSVTGHGPEDSCVRGPCPEYG